MHVPVVPDVPEVPKEVPDVPEVPQVPKKMYHKYLKCRMFLSGQCLWANRMTAQQL
jgi:hypothetical protein